jgi:hypothetical protein
MGRTGQVANRLLVGLASTEIVGNTAQTTAALWILNVWFNRFNKDTGYRGGAATNMVEEFEECGLSKNTIYTILATKVSLASLIPSVAGF